jgi:hypothetical protein
MDFTHYLLESDQLKLLKRKLKKEGPGVAITLDGRDTVYVDKIKGIQAEITVNTEDGEYNDVIDISTAIYTIDENQKQKRKNMELFKTMLSEERLDEKNLKLLTLDLNDVSKKIEKEISNSTDRKAFSRAMSKIFDILAREK